MVNTIFNVKNAIGPVVAVALLLVVAVFSTVGFQSWTDSYLSNLESKSESSSNAGILEVVLAKSEVGKTAVYLKNDVNTYTLISKMKVNGNDCNLVGSNIAGELSTTKVDVDCLIPKGDTAEVVIISGFGIFEGTVVVK